MQVFHPNHQIFKGINDAVLISNRGGWWWWLKWMISFFFLFNPPVMLSPLVSFSILLEGIIIFILKKYLLNGVVAG